MRPLDEAWWKQVLAGSSGTLHAPDSDEHYVVLPRTADPRVVVDPMSPPAVRDAVQRFASSRTTNKAIRVVAGASSRFLTKTNGAWAIAASADGVTLREYLSDLVGEPVRLSIAVGPPRPNRKPVIRCYGERGLVAVAKLGPSPHTAEMVNNEARWLGALDSAPLDGVTTPELLHVGSYAGSALLVMRALDLDSDLGLDFGDVPIEVVRELSDRYRGDERLIDTQWWHDLARRIEHRDLRPVAAQIAEVQLNPLFNDIQISAWHGDWSPWNMGRAPDGALCIWDWERSMIGVPVGFDLLHLHFQYGAGLDGADSDLRALGVPDGHHRLIKRLYLFEVCARHADADARSGDRYDRALQALSDISHHGVAG